MAGLSQSARRFLAVSRREKDEKEALDNIKEAITAWLWAEDQKAMKALPPKPGQEPIMVAV